MNPQQLIFQVRQRMNNPLYQSPSPRQILNRAIDEYRNAVVRANNTGNAWAVKEYTLTTIDGQRRYQIAAADFSKALLIATIPDPTPGIIQPEVALEFTQLEQLPNDWEFLAKTASWSLWSYGVTQMARFAAHYREVDAGGFTNYLEIRPTPGANETYRVLYQVGDFSGGIASTMDFKFPFPELDFYFLTLVCDGLLPLARWTNDGASDEKQGKMLSNQYAKDLIRYEQTFRDFIASLTVSDIVYSDSFADLASGM
jgi:hypothetical protein